jgi:hypothetical protein
MAPVVSRQQQTYRHSNGISYKLRVGKRGGTYILVENKKVYVQAKKQRQRGGSHEEDSDDLLSDDDTQTQAIFKQRWMEQMKKQQEAASRMMELLQGFLKTQTRSNNYMIIGGKAAIFHIDRRSPQASNESPDREIKDLVYTSNDYDIVIRKSDERAFLDALTAYTKSKSLSLDTPLVKEMGDGVKIYLIGRSLGGKLDNVLDIHVHPDSDPVGRQISSGAAVKGDDGLLYAPLAAICKDLDITIRERSSKENVTKLRKRLARQALLGCNKMNSKSRDQKA